MRGNSVLTIGFLAMMAATVGLNASTSLAAHPDRVDVIGTVKNETVAQVDSTHITARQSRRVDVIDSIGSKGPAYPYSRSMSH